MNPCELTASISALAITLASKLSDNELSLVSAVLTQLGDTLTTILVQRELCDDKQNANNNSINE